MSEDAPATGGQSRGCAPPLPPELCEVPDGVELKWLRPTLRTRMRARLRALGFFLPLLSKERWAAAARGPVPDGSTPVVPWLPRRLAYVLRATVRGEFASQEEWRRRLDDGIVESWTLLDIANREAEISRQVRQARREGREP